MFGTQEITSSAGKHQNSLDIERINSVYFIRALALRAEVFFENIKSRIDGTSSIWGVYRRVNLLLFGWCGRVAIPGTHAWDGTGMTLRQIGIIGMNREGDRGD
jgi:hypothetical protein